MKKTIITLLLFLTVFISNLGGVHLFSEAEKEHMVRGMEQKIRIDDIRGSEFSPQLLLEYLSLTGVLNPEVAYSQAVLETGWFKHIRATDYNNYFGMKEAKTRDHTQLGVWKNHATYEHWTLSADDYKLWQEYWCGEGFDQTDYLQFLNNVGYATAINYTKVLRKIINSET